MRANLANLRTEIQEYLESRGIAVFHGYPNSHDAPAVYWDVETRPDYRAFIAAAEKAGVRLVTLYANEFTMESIEDAEDRLDSLVSEERRELEQRIRSLRGYAGFICQIELSFDLGPRVYIFDLRADWFKELGELLEDIDTAEEEDPLSGGYFSKN